MNRLAEILGSAHTIAVVGLSGKRYRSSYGVAEYMKRAGYRIIPVNPHEREVLGDAVGVQLLDQEVRDARIELQRGRRRDGARAIVRLDSHVVRFGHGGNLLRFHDSPRVSDIGLQHVGRVQL